MNKPTKKFNKREWTVHPNRSEAGPDEPGRNGHFRSVSRPPYKPEAGMCFVRVELPTHLSHFAEPDGSLTFGGYDWWFPLGAAHTFARLHTDVEVPNPFGYSHRKRWYWWDGSVTEESRLDQPDETRHVREFFELLFPGLPMTLIDLR